MMGRITLLEENPEIYHDQVVNLFKMGAKVGDVCRAVGISERAYQLWMKKGREGYDEIYIRFFRDVTRAQGEARIHAIAKLRIAIEEGDTKAAMWFLERSDPENWGRQTKQTLEVNTNVPLLNKVVSRIEKLGLDPTEVFERMLHQLEAQLLPEEVDGD